jgi:hypothetical protein
MPEGVELLETPRWLNGEALLVNSVHGGQTEAWILTVGSQKSPGNHAKRS